AWSTRGQQELAHRSCQTGCYGHDIVRDEVHGVIDGHACSDRTTWRVDVQVDVLFRILCREQQQLRADGIRVVIADIGAQPDDALLEQAVVDVVITAGRL